MANVDSGSELDRSAATALDALTQAIRRAQGDGSVARDAAVVAPSTAGALVSAIEPLQVELAGVTRGLNDVNSGLGENSQALGSFAEGLNGALRGAVGLLSGGLGQGGGVGSFLKGGFGLAPLAGSIVGLFRGGSDESEPEPTPFHLPPSIALERANGPLGSLAPTVGEAGGAVRRVASRTAATEITVNIQAMDSQSFLDRSQDIARAVRDAMLHMHPVNDVIDEL
ncbi:MAG: hypothetical protein GC160_19535 [Acidobacteria bacterium]|nr:hypothetical protein [Acidobacteriota bacterium]